MVADWDVVSSLLGWGEGARARAVGVLIALPPPRRDMEPEVDVVPTTPFPPCRVVCCAEEPVGEFFNSP